MFAKIFGSLTIIAIDVLIMSVIVLSVLDKDSERYKRPETVLIKVVIISFFAACIFAAALLVCAVWGI